MSLINRLLRDLDKRRAGQSDNKLLPGNARAVAVPERRRKFSLTIWLLPLLALAVAAALYLWQTDSRFKSRVDGLLASSGVIAPAAEKQSVAPKMIRAEVEAALMIPVLQMSNELAVLPETIRAVASVGELSPPPLQKSEDKGLESRNGQMSEQNAAITTPDPQPRRDAKPVVAQQPKATAKPVAAAVSGTKPVAPKEPKAPRPKATDTVKPSTTGLPEALEEVVISADSPRSPIAKQARQLTPFERAENAFRQGVAKLRQGRMADAEAHFRLAVKEDRSHVAAQQALVGILIDGGRLADAEAVLRDALSVNPRQPRQAMILARLQVERGDLNAAIRTLERVNAYAENDARYYSFLAAVLQRASRHKEAATQYRNSLALAPGNAIWLMGLGISLRALGESETAKDAFKRAATTGTLNPDLQAFVEQQYTELNLAKR